jgi:hypothetical protein
MAEPPDSYQYGGITNYYNQMKRYESMAGFDPVQWDTIEAVRGAPAEQVTTYVERLRDSVADDPASASIEAVYNEWKGDLGEERVPSDQGAAFLIAYLLEQEEVLNSEETDDTTTYPSMIARRPSAGRLHEMFWDLEYPMWLMAVETGTHMSPIYHWLWEENIPLMERNFPEKDLQQIKSHQQVENENFDR